MIHLMRAGALSFLAGACLLFGGITPAVAGLTIGFEQPEFVAGVALEEQGFDLFGGYSAYSGFVVDNVSSTGSQSAVIYGDKLTALDEPGFYGVFYSKAIGEKLSSFSVSIDISLDDQVGDPLDLTASIQLYDPDSNYIAGIGFSALRGLFFDNYDFEEFATSGGFGVFHTLLLEVDFKAALIKGSVNGQLLGTLALTGPALPELADIDLTFTSFGAPIGTNAYFDNINYVGVRAVPEPSSLVLALSALLCGIPFARRRWTATRN